MWREREGYSYSDQLVAMTLTLKPDFRPEPLETNLTVMAFFLETKAEKSFGTEEPQSQTFV